MIQLRLGLLGAGLLCFAPLSLAIGRSPLADSTDVLISNTPYERENAVSVSPLNPNSVLVANNGGAGGVTAWTSVDGGVTWSTNGSFAFGDPATAIIANPAYGQHGRFVVLALGLALAKVEVNYKDQIAQNWSSRIVTELGPADKGHIWVDNSPHSGSLRFRTYAAWMRGTRQIVVATSLDGGDNWSEAEIPHTNPTPTSQTSWGANVHTGRTGRVYVVWPRRTAGSTDQAETKAFGFSEMLTVDPLAFQMEIGLPPV